MRDSGNPPPGWRLVHLERVDSTNRWALDHLPALSDRTAVTAGEQTAGRGRLGRSWFSPPALNLYLTAVLRPGPEAPGFCAANVAQVMGLAVAMTLEGLGITPELKWPNDVLVRGEKLAGILAESRSTGPRFEGCVVGVGLNLNMDATLLGTLPFRATSLKVLTGREACPEMARDLLLTRFEELYETFRIAGFGALAPAFRTRADLEGRRVRVAGPGGTTEEGIVEALDDDGSLLLRCDGGRVRRVLAGDVEEAESRKEIGDGRNR